MGVILLGALLGGWSPCASASAVCKAELLFFMPVVIRCYDYVIRDFGNPIATVPTLHWILLLLPLIRSSYWSTSILHALLVSCYIVDHASSTN